MSIVGYIELLILIILALISDIKTYKIKNAIVVPFWLIGIATNIFMRGAAGGKAALMGIAMPIILLILLYILRMLGAGDIKLFAAVGAIMGVNFVLYSMAYSFLSGGIIALLIVLSNRNGCQRFRYFFNYIKGCFLSVSLRPYTNFNDKSEIPLCLCNCMWDGD